MTPMRGRRSTPSPDDPARRRWLQLGGSALLAGWLLPQTRLQAGEPGRWPQWQAFVARHVQPDGRVVDFSTPDQRSTSESQSYALFFALCANDPGTFQKVLDWTEANLAMGYLDQRLPAWLWGKADDGNWKVLDDNSAADADLWMSYALLEAGRLWNKPAYSQLGQRLLALVQAQEVTTLPGLGRMLLPGAKGFALPNQQWRLNPSYLPLQLLRRFAALQPHGPWKELADASVKLLQRSAPAGFAPDWTDWNGSAFVTDAQYGTVSSYDAIRVYLWAGMLAPGDPQQRALLQGLSGPLGLLQAQGQLFEKVDIHNGVGSGKPPIGYAGAMLPYLKAQAQNGLLAGQLHRVQGAFDADGRSSLPYYERVLILFGQGWLEGRFSFAADGRLQPRWSKS